MNELHAQHIAISLSGPLENVARMVVVSIG